MVDRVHRVRLRSDFERVRRSGRRVGDILLRMRWAQNEESTTRFGFVVGRRVAARAHDRNRVRRRLRELARRFIPLLPEGQDIVFSAQTGAADASYWELEEAMLKLLRRAGLLARLPAPEAKDGEACDR